MKKEIKCLWIPALLAFLPFLVGNALGCSCRPQPSLKEEFERSSAVFTGRVVSSNDVKVGEDIERHYRVQVLTPLKGVEASEVTISAGEIDSSCYIDFYEIGRSYLIYTDRPYQGVYIAGVFCSRISELERANTQLYFIKEFLKGKPEPMVYGSVYMKSGMEGIPIVVQSDSKNFTTFTDKNGIFKFDSSSNRRL